MSFAVLSALEIDASPGALSMSLNTTSINNLMNTFVPILAYFVLNNSTFNISETISGCGYKLDVESLHIIEASGFTVKEFTNVPGTNQLHVKIGGVDVSTLLNAELTALYFIPFKTSAVNVTNATIELTLESTSDDKVHWQIKEHTVLTVGKVDIQMSNNFLNWLVEKSSSIINKVIQDQLPKISSVIDAEVEKINQMLAQEGPYTFDVSLLGHDYPLNLTMTTAPQIGGDLIQMYMDGLFHPAANGSDPGYPLEVNSEWPERFEHSLSEQVFIHESTLNSLFRLMGGAGTTLKGHNIQNAVKAALPELAQKYGSDYSVSLGLVLHPANSATPITLNSESGIVLGNGNSMDGTLTISCSNASVSNEEAVVLGMNILA
jgi:hypothetical protein